MDRRAANKRLAEQRDAAQSEEERLLHRNQLVEANLGLVHYFINRRYHSFPREVREELIAESYIILIETCDLWDPELGALGSYLLPRIRRRCMRVLDSLGKPVQVPERAARRIRRGKEAPVYGVEIAGGDPSLVDAWTPLHELLHQEIPKFH